MKHQSIAALGDLIKNLLQLLEFSCLASELSNYISKVLMLVMGEGCAKISFV